MDADDFQIQRWEDEGGALGRQPDSEFESLDSAADPASWGVDVDWRFRRIEEFAGGRTCNRSVRLASGGHPSHGRDTR